MKRMTTVVLLLFMTLGAGAQNLKEQEKPVDAPGTQLPAPARPAVDTVIVNEGQIREKTNLFIRAVIDCDIAGLAGLLDPEGGIEVVGGVSMTRQEVLDDLGRKGSVYDSLFDSKRYLERNADALRGYSTPDVGDFSLCLRDVFVAVKDRRIRIREVMVFEPGVLGVVLGWNGKDDAASPSRRVNYVVSFVLRNGNWYINGLDIRREIFR